MSTIKERSVSVLDMREDSFIPQSALERTACAAWYAVYDGQARTFTVPEEPEPGESIGTWKRRIAHTLRFKAD